MSQRVDVKIKLKDGAKVPQYQTSLSAGFDLCALLPSPLVIGPKERVLVPTGIYIELPAGFELQVRPRSGLAFKHGITLPNTPGTIDADYRGEVSVALVNTSTEPFTVENGMRIAQGIVSPVWQAQFEVVDTLTPTSRQDGGFGSTGLM